MTAPNLLRGGLPPNTPDRQKWVLLERLPAQDATQEHVRHLANALWSVAMVVHRDRRVRVFAQLAQSVARDAIRFASDTQRTGGEDIAGITRSYGDPLEPLERGADDCDAKARLFVALCLARRLQAHLVPWWDPATGALRHVSAEVAIDGAWVAVETILARARLGEDHPTVPGELGAKGRWLYS